MSILKTISLILSLKPHLFAALAMFMLIAFMAVEQNALRRGLLIAPIALLFFAFMALYGLEVDAAKQTAQSQKTKPE